MAERELLVGLVGLVDNEWAEDFYPDDIPPDWRFAFLTNEVRAVLLTESDVAALPDDPEDWAEEIDEGFHYLHLPDADLQSMGRQLAVDGAVCLELPDRDVCWTPVNPKPQVPVGIVKLSRDPTPAELRGWVEDFIRQAPPEGDLVLLFDGRPAAYAVRDARVLVELMGY